MAWLRYIKETPEHKVHDVVWVEDKKVWKKDVDKKVAKRCTGPDGVSFEEARPEAVAKVIKDES